MNPRNPESLPARAWTAAKGAAKYAAAIATGDIAPPAVVAQRRAACRACPARVVARAEGATEASDWCGEPFVDRTGEPATDDRACGCLLAGKTEVASEACPRGRWAAVTIKGAQPWA